MSESEYYQQEEEKRAKKLRKRSAAESLLESDSEDEVKRLPKKSTKPARKAAQNSSSKTKKEPTKSEKSGTSSTAAAAFNDLFGEQWEETQSLPLYSSLCRYLPTGTVRTTQVLDGEFYIELRVFDSAAIRELPFAKRYEEVQAILRLQLSHNDPQWALVKQLFKEGKKKFDKEGVFYAKEKK